jgi:hypothetical protein
VEATTARVDSWPCEAAKDRLQADHAPDVDYGQRDCEGAVDEGTVMRRSMS